MMDLLHQMVDFILHAVEGMGYTGIVLLMALESSFVPFPSEVVVPPAGYLASKGQMNIYLVIIAGIAGSIIGALVNYGLAVYFGRPFLNKFGKYFLISPDRLLKTDKYFVEHGEITTFAGRLIPGIRQYISFPAGLCRMNIAKFSFYTGLGAGIWVVILALLGYFIGQNEELMKSNLKTISIVLAVSVILIVTAYVYLKRRKRI